MFQLLDDHEYQIFPSINLILQHIQHSAHHRLQRDSHPSERGSGQYAERLRNIHLRSGSAALGTAAAHDETLPMEGRGIRRNIRGVYNACAPQRGCSVIKTTRVYPTPDSCCRRRISDPCRRPYCQPEPAHRQEYQLSFRRCCSPKAHWPGRRHSTHGAWTVL